jgi:hypothetical protein
MSPAHIVVAVAWFLTYAIAVVLSVAQSEAGWIHRSRMLRWVINAGPYVVAMVPAFFNTQGIQRTPIDTLLFAATFAALTAVIVFAVRKQWSRQD